MATPAQIAANQANSQLSTGPKEGKAVSRFNALTHGLTSSKIILPHEHAAEWEAFRKMTVESLNPKGEEEELLAVTIAEHRWRIRRFAHVETALLEARMKAVAEADPNLTDGDAALAQLFIDPEEQKRLSLLLRYQSAADRAHRKALNELQALQTARRELAMMQSMQSRHPKTRELRNEANPGKPSFSMKDIDLALRL